MHPLIRLCLALFTFTAVACDDEGPDTGSADTETTTESAPDTDASTGPGDEDPSEPGPVSGGSQGTLGQPPAGDEPGDDSGDTIGHTTLATPEFASPASGG